MLELAAHYGSNEPVRIRTIADEHGVPARFLVQILLQLKGAGFVASTRGASGGYQLVKAPDEISLGEIMAVIEGQNHDPPSTSVSSSSATGRVLTEAWQEISQVEYEMLRSITFGDLVDRVKGRNQN